MIMSLVSFMLMNVPSAQAALPPYYDRVNQIKAILDSKDVANALNGSMIKSIQYVEQTGMNIEFSVLSEKCSHNIKLLGRAPLPPTPPPNEPHPPFIVGPTYWEVSDIQSVCLP